MTMLRIICFFVINLIVTQLAHAQLAQIKAAVLKVGTVNWELDTIIHNGFDKDNGFKLEVTGMASISATRIAFQAGEADVMVADWVWVARQRASGKDYMFIPYSKSVGTLMVKKSSPFETLPDLEGKKIGIAGGPVDKSWLIMRAYAQKQYGFDLVAKTEQVFGSPPLIFKTALKGEIDGAINFWHFAAKMSTRDMRPLVSVADAARELGLDPNVPLLGYVINGELARSNPALVAGFINASRAAKMKLSSDPSAWDRLRGMMRAKKDTDFEALKAGFIQGIPLSQEIDVEAAAKVFEVMAKLGGEKLVGSAKILPEGVFVQLQD